MGRLLVKLNKLEIVNVRMVINFKGYSTFHCYILEISIWSVSFIKGRKNDIKAIQTIKPLHCHAHHRLPPDEPVGFTITSGGHQTFTGLTIFVMAYGVVINSRQKQKIKIQSCSSGPFFSATYFYDTIISNEQRKYRNNTQVISLHLSIHNKASMNEFPFRTLPRISMLLMGDENKTAPNLTAYNFLLGQLARMLIPRAWMVHSSSRAIYCWASPYLPHILYCPQ